MSYIGNDPAYWNLNVNKYSYTATAAQTSFFAVYDTVVDVYLNGSKLASTDYTATDGMTVVLSSPATLGDIIDIAGYFNFTNFDVDVYLPSQTNNAGKSLTTDGAGTLNWSGPHAPIASPTFTGIPLLSQSPNTGDYNKKIPTTSSVNLATRQELKKTNQGYGCVWNQVADTYVTRGTTYQSYGYSWNQSTDVYTTILTN